MNSEWREIFEQEMEREADAIMEEVNSDPALRDVQAPPGMYEEIMKMIYEHEKEKIYEQLSEEDREYLRIGKTITRRRKFNRYIVLVAAMVFVLAFGTVSIGKKESIFNIISNMFLGRERTTVDSDEAEPILYVNEHEVHEKIEEVYGFTPVKLGYLPKNTNFYEATFNQGIQSINMIYEMSNTTSLIYVIKPNFRAASFGTDIEDEKIQEYRMTVNDVEIMIAEYLVAETRENQWAVHFMHDDVLYMIRIPKVKQEEMEKIVSNLRFPLQ